MAGDSTGGASSQGDAAVGAAGAKAGPTAPPLRRRDTPAAQSGTAGTGPGVQTRGLPSPARGGGGGGRGGGVAGTAAARVHRPFRAPSGRSRSRGGDDRGPGGGFLGPGAGDDGYRARQHLVRSRSRTPTARARARPPTRRPGTGALLTDREREWGQPGTERFLAHFTEWVDDILRADCDTPADDAQVVQSVLRSNHIRTIYQLAMSDRVQLAQWQGATADTQILPGTAVPLTALIEVAKQEVASSVGVAGTGALLAGRIGATGFCGGAGFAGGLPGTIQSRLDEVERGARLRRRQQMTSRYAARKFFVPRCLRPDPDFLDTMAQNVTSDVPLTYMCLDTGLQLHFDSQAAGGEDDAKALGWKLATGQEGNVKGDGAARLIKAPTLATALINRLAYITHFRVEDQVTEVQAIRYLAAILNLARTDSFAVAFQYEATIRKRTSDDMEWEAVDFDIMWGPPHKNSGKDFKYNPALLEDARRTVAQRMAANHPLRRTSATDSRPAAETHRAETKTDNTKPKLAADLLPMNETERGTRKLKCMAEECCLAANRLTHEGEKCTSEKCHYKHNCPYCGKHTPQCVGRTCPSVQE